MSVCAPSPSAANRQHFTNKKYLEKNEEIRGRAVTAVAAAAAAKTRDSRQREIEKENRYSLHQKLRACVSV